MDSRFHLPFEMDVEIPTAPQSILAINATDRQDFDIFDAHALTFISEDRIATERLTARGFTVESTLSESHFPVAIVFFGRHRAANEAMIGAAYAALDEGGVLVIDSDKTDGIDAVLRDMKKKGATLRVEPKSHGKVVWLRRSNDNDFLRMWRDRAEPFVNDAGFHVRPGIFSADKIDKGTALLLEHLPKNMKGRVADFGAGYGAISKTLLETYPAIARLDLFEVNKRAIDLAARNIDDERAHFLWENVTAAEAKSYDWVVSNPPFHVGRAAEPELGRAFIKAAAQALKPNGSLLIVANRQLPYEKDLESLFVKTERLTDTGGYKLLLASRVRSKPRP